MNILLLSPDQADDEFIRRWRGALVQDALSLPGLKVQPLLGDVRTEDVIRAVGEERYDVLMVLSHNTSEGIQLSGKSGNSLKGLPDEREFLTASTLASLARSGLRLVYLLSCETVETGHVIMEAAGVDVICSVPALLVDEAYRTASLWLRALVRNGGDFRAAYEQARPADRTYLYLSAAPRSARGFESMMDDDRRTLDRHDRDLTRHEELLRSHGSEIYVLKETVNRKTPASATWLVLGIIVVSGIFVLLLVYTLGATR